MWATADTLKRQRMNRSDILGRLLMPMLDKNQADTVHVTPIAVNGTSVTTTEATSYTVPGGTAVAIVQRITVTNIHTASRNAQIHLIASGGSRSVSNRILSDNIEAGELLVIEGPFFLATGDTLRTISSNATGTQLSIRADVLEFVTQPDGATMVIDQGDALTAALVTYYTAPTSGLSKAMLLHVALCNTDSVARDVDLHLVPNGGAASAANQIFNDTLQPGETAFAEGPFVMNTGDFLRALASAASVVSLRATPIEVA